MNLPRLGETVRAVAARHWRFVVAWVVLLVVTFALGRRFTVALGAEVPAFDVGTLATIAGIALGAPIAVVIAMEQTRAAREESERERRKRHEELLRIIQGDLQDARTEVARRRASRELVVAPFLGGGLWRALQASGEVGLIRNPRTLRAIARAYDRISLTAYLERQAWETFHNPVARMATDPPQDLIQRTADNVGRQDEHTLAAIDDALEVLKGELSADKGSATMAD